MTGPGTVLWSLVCGSARCRSRWSAAWTWWHMCVRQPGAATRPVRDGPRSGGGHTWRLSAARPCRPRPVRMGVQPEALAL
jgi:hypothetical protein